jgi:hypothetical protein
MGEMSHDPIEYAGDEPILWPFVIWLLTLFGGVVSGLIIGFAAWGIK